MLLALPPEGELIADSRVTEAYDKGEGKGAVIYTEIAVRDTIHGRPVRNTEALANPQALDLFKNLEELAR